MSKAAKNSTGAGTRGAAAASTQEAENSTVAIPTEEPGTKEPAKIAEATDDNIEDNAITQSTQAAAGEIGAS